MSERSYRDPLTPEEREKLEEDLISFCDRQLDLLGGIQGLDVLYAGGSSLLWIEGLSHRVGRNGSLTVLDLDEETIENTRERLAEADLESPVNLVTGDVFAPPLEGETFDLAYSAGLFHELDVAEESAEEALSSLARLVRIGGRVATTDFVDSVPAVHIEDERLGAALVDELFGQKLYGIGPPERLVALHESVLEDVSWRVLPPRPIRRFEKLALAEEEPEGLLLSPAESRDRFRRRRSTLMARIRHEGYTRPATLYVEGRVAGG
ncbi:MAG: class I SAM-dependent methyltransferase [Actinomycetota bacterium]|nr:class I SAM-dependent methyltransferase [Actinomycetota bacterium]